MFSFVLCFASQKRFDAVNAEAYRKGNVIFGIRVRPCKLLARAGTAAPPVSDSLVEGDAGLQHSKDLRTCAAALQK